MILLFPLLHCSPVFQDEKESDVNGRFVTKIDVNIDTIIFFPSKKTTYVSVLKMPDLMNIRPQAGNFSL